ncbi:Asp23/Gls24 family envelope stress response protein [Amycolatopsis sp. NPDC051716]|uniref:Asp23/Gls24 family envelope stress response protein n=1 Tax=Amycolatopsis sp. NPDC051716 TaxID=3155804 RepID=UPI00343B3940
MSDVINSIFGRPKNESTGSGEYAYGTVEPAPAVAPSAAEAAVIEEADSAPEAEAATETAEAETADSDQVEDESAEEPTEEPVGDTAEAGEDVTGTDAEDTGEDAAETEPVAEVAEDEPVAEAVEAEPVVAEAVEAEPIADAEPVVPEAEPAAEAAPVADAEPAAARPAAGSRGSTTVADGVVGKIVVRIAAQTEGVHSVAEDGIKVELADEVAWVTIPVVVEFGHAVKAVGEQIRVAVIGAVEQYLGLDVEVVDVHVTDIHFPEAD